jgi:hypothetical protein
MEAHPLFHQDGRGDRALLAKDAEQEMFSADVVVQQSIGFFGRVLQHPLGFGAERNLDRRRHLLAEYRAAFDVFPNVFEGQVGSGKDPACQALALANQAQQQVLGLD